MVLNGDLSSLRRRPPEEVQPSVLFCFHAIFFADIVIVLLCALLQLDFSFRALLAILIHGQRSPVQKRSVDDRRDEDQVPSSFRKELLPKNPE